MKLLDLPNELLEDITKKLNYKENVIISNVNKDIYYKRFKINRYFNLKELKLLLQYINNIEELEIDDCDLFFIMQLTFPNLHKIIIRNCNIEYEILKMYKNNIQLEINNCYIY